MLNEVEVRTSQGLFLTMPLDDITDGIVIQEIEGLDPVKATLISSKYAKLRGSLYQSSSVDDRNIKFKFGLEPYDALQTVQAIRDKLYGYFMPESPVELRFRKSTGLEVMINGVVESCENPLFTAEPTVDVSIMCFDTDFVDPDVIEIAGSTVSDATTFDLEYIGNAPTSILFTLMPNRDITQFTIYCMTPDGNTHNLDFAASMMSGDELIINTKPGSKSVTQLRSGSTYATPLYGVSPQSGWPLLRKGPNTFRVYAEGAPVPFLISYNTRYGGL